MRIRKIIKTARGYEPALSEEDVLGLIRNWLEVIMRAKVFRAIERVPKCYRCGLWLGSSEAGTPDLSGLIPRKDSFPFPFYFEIKRNAKAKKREAQIARIEEIRGIGGCAAIVSSLDEVKAELARFTINEA